jgi:hypothetical protein
MSDLRELLGGIVDDVDAVCLFSPSGSFYESFADADVPVVVIAPENAVDADNYVELPLEFAEVRERIRFGLEGALDNGFLEEEYVVACATKMFDSNIDSVTRVNAGEFSRSGIYSLFADSPASSATCSRSPSNSARRDRRASRWVRCSSSATPAR